MTAVQRQVRPASEAAARGELLVAARAVSVILGGRAVLDRVDVTVARGEIVTIVGLNGSGKSTLVRALIGLIEPGRGEVWRRPGLRIGYQPQHVAIDRTLPLTVGRFLALGGAASPSERKAGLAEVGAEALFASQLADLSGGELQRVLLARALLREPDLLALDEPMSGVDVAGQAELYRLIADLRDRRGCGVLLVSHDLHLVMAATDTVVCLNHHVCCTGRPQAVVEDPEFVTLFGRRVAESMAVYRHVHDHYHDPAGDAVPLRAERRARPSEPAGASRRGGAAEERE